jgi:hypothetical protein
VSQQLVSRWLRSGRVPPDIAAELVLIPMLAGLLRAGVITPDCEQLAAEAEAERAERYRERLSHGFREMGWSEDDIGLLL